MEANRKQTIRNMRRLANSQRDLSEVVQNSKRTIKGIIDDCSAESIIGVILTKNISYDLSKPELSSHAKQIDYLLSILVSSPEPTNPIEFDYQAWNQVITPLEDAFMAYIKLYLPNKGAIEKQSKDWVHAREVSMLAYGNTLHKAPLVSVEQMIERIRIYLTPFDTQLVKDFGLSATHALLIAEWLRAKLEAPLEEIRKGHLHAVLRVGKISFRDIIDAFGLIGATFWKLFTIERGAGPDIVYPTETNIVAERPLIVISAETAMCYRYNQLLNAIFSRAERCLSDGTARDAYFRHRDKTLEEQSAIMFKRILGHQAQLHQNVFETPQSQNEHDLVAVVDKTCLFIESKASPPKETFRDPDKAFERLRRDFGSDAGIQNAYEQALSLYKVYLSGKDITLYDRRGNLTLQLEPKDLNNVFCICVTRDDFGPLATNLSLLLEKSVSDPYPWAVNIMDLENLAETWEYLGWNVRQLVSYLAKRNQLHGSVISDDELDYAGAFIRHSGLHHFVVGPGTLIQLAPTYSDVFDDIHRRIYYGQPLVEPKEPDQDFQVNPTPATVEPEDQCPCESGVEFKHCHGAHEWLGQPQPPVISYLS